MFPCWNVNLPERLQCRLVQVLKCSHDETSMPKWLLPKCSVPKWSIGQKIAHLRIWNQNAGISGDFKTTLFPFDILASLNSGEPSPCTMSSSRKNNIQRWKLDWEIHSSKHFSKPTSLRAESSISNPTEKSNYHNLFNHIRRWNIWSETNVWSKAFRSLKVQVCISEKAT